MSSLHLLLSFLSSVLLLCCVSVSSIFTMKDPDSNLVACRPNHIKALTQFKNEFDSTGCNQTDYFNGVLCDNTTGEVTKLQVPIGCFSGTLNSNSILFQFHHLRFLNLSYNDFTSSSLPSGFGNLNKLEVLSLSSNGFKGLVPSSFSNLSLLSFLDLSHNELTGSFPLIGNLTKLSFIDLSLNNFFGNIPSSLFSMPFLSFLDLSLNQLTGPIEISNSSSRLDHIGLGSNLFEGDILKPISKLTSLTQLDLSFLNISYPIDISIFSSLKSLMFLDVSGNSLSQDSVSSYSGIPLSIGGLFLSECNMTSFPNILKPLKNLTFIDISSNGIKGKVPEWFWSLPSLTSVVFSDNYLNGFEGSSEVLVNSSVGRLDLSNNSFNGIFPIPPLSIVSLHARGNDFTGNIPLSICNCNSLKVLDLAYNSFTGLVPQCLSNLTLLCLRKNHLQGSLPDIFQTGSLMRTLDVGYNQLTGKLPKSLLNCTSLELLSVEHNRIQDSFPFWLKALPNLQVLILRSNRFYGPISQGPLAFPELRIFEISENNFTGSLSPSYFVNWKATSLERNEDGSVYMGYKTQEVVLYNFQDAIDLQYKGLLMEQQKVLVFYSTIDISGNRLEGEIPESIGLLKTLIALNLSNNAFTGHIPLSLANVTELESLDMSRNQISGTIPNELKNLTSLAYINVSHNQLTGEIPQGPQFTGQAKSSFEGNVGLCGLPLKDRCFAPPLEGEDEEEEKVEIFNWKTVAIGYATGVLFGLGIAEVIASYKRQWLVKIIGPRKCLTNGF